MSDKTVDKCEKCGYDLDTFACKIRCHIQINTGAAKASRDFN